MPTILDTLVKGAAYLEKHGVEEPRLNMEHLVAHLLRTGRMQLYLDFDRPLDETVLEPLRILTKRRAIGEPLQHLLGNVEFCGREFVSDARALVPRPETEELVEALVARIPAEWPGQPARLSLLDLGCGSGVIGLSLALRLPAFSRTVLADRSAEALNLARENARRLAPETALEFVESDLFDRIEGRFHLVAANLPYIPAAEETRLSREVRRDPAIALYGGERGTETMTRFLADAPASLEPGALIAMEFGIGQGEELRTLAEDLGYAEVELRPDISGIERFLFARHQT